MPGPINHAMRCLFPHSVTMALLQKKQPALRADWHPPKSLPAAPPRRKIRSGPFAEHVDAIHDI